MPTLDLAFTCPINPTIIKAGDGYGGVIPGISKEIENEQA